MPEIEVVPVPSSKLLTFPISEETLRANRQAPAFDGPISGSMWRKLATLKSTYPDTFDWAVYDRIYEKFGENQPRGGVVFKTGLKLANHHGSCSKCHYALEIDTYGRGCIHNCSYCYAKEQLTRHGYWNKPHPMPLDLSEVRKTFYTVFETNKSHEWRRVLEQRVPIRIGSMSDSFMWMDQKYRITYEFLKILRFYNYPYIIFTRSDLIARDEYLKVMDPGLGSIQFSICSTDDTLTRVIEPGAPSVKRRLSALKTLAEAGFWTGVRINPLFPTFPDGYFTDEASVGKKFGSLGSVPKFSFFDITRSREFLASLKESKVPSVLAGFVRLSTFAIADLHTTTGVNLREFFRSDIPQNQNDKRYSDSEIAYYYKKLQNDCSKEGIRFTTCYIGNGLKDYFQYQTLWSNKDDCCDARGNVPGFRNSSQSIDWSERIKHTPNKEAAHLNQMAELEADEQFTPGLKVLRPMVKTAYSEASRFPEQMP